MSPCRTPWRNIFREDLQHSSSRRCAKISQTCFTVRIQNRYETAGPSTDPIETARRIAIVSDIRRGYIERFEAQKKSQEQEKAIFQSIDNSRFNGSAPAISVDCHSLQLRRLHSAVPQKPGGLADCSDSRRNRSRDCQRRFDRDSLKQAMPGPTKFTSSSSHYRQTVKYRVSRCPQSRSSASACALRFYPGCG